MTGSARGPGRIRIGISSCLLGEQVRYDGGHKHDRFLADVLGPHVEWVPVCPELEIGMGVPREPVRLVGAAESPRMLGVDSGEDWTERMLAWSRKRSGQLGKLDLSGYVLKSKSPSCGMERVKLYPAGSLGRPGSAGRPGARGSAGVASKDGRGLFAGVFIRDHPLVPVEEEGRLNDPHIRESFIVRVFAFHRLNRLTAGEVTPGKLVEFHTAEKYLLMAHSPTHYRELGRIVAGAGAAGRAAMRALTDRYGALFMECLRSRSTVKKNVNVLQHIVGFLPDAVPAPERHEILRVIEDYRKELVPLVVPVTLLRHYVRAHSIGYIGNQTYLDPHPKELMLRNHV